MGDGARVENNVDPRMTVANLAIDEKISQWHVLGRIFQVIKKCRPE